jgi:hypothetical protein
MPYGMTLLLLCSVAKVVGLQYVPSPPACLWMTPWAMPFPGGELSGHP